MIVPSVIPDDEFRDLERPSLNRLCNSMDWGAWEELSDTMKEMHDAVTVHRKSWEFALCVLGLRRLGMVRPEASAIAVGAGYERPLFLFANLIRRMVATDLYDQRHPEGQPAMLTEPASFAPFPYREDHLEVHRMPGDDLRFADDEFDFSFCLSSIEHFGSRNTQRRSLEEMRRVVRPGGIVCIATELILGEGHHPEYFRPEELDEMFLRHPGLELVGGPLDLRIQQSLIDWPVDVERHRNINGAPHVTLISGGCLITSVMMFLRVTE